ncbi:DUF4405 domain-containing protein [Mangrovibacterium sp.]|uniref:DUF4405 domain-containing protein n=1 Tax=Mangrovibacterium sp. TaxID=1961364 RepID=UPI00356B4EEF
MNETTRSSKSRRNYYVDIASFFPFLLLLISGIIMLVYHAGKPASETILGKDSHFWLNTHIVFAVISIVATAIHLSLHLNWFKKLFSGTLKNKYWLRNLILLVLFLITTLTSVVPWLFFDESPTATAILGIHNKFGLILVVFFAIHLLSYFSWLINMTKKVFANNRP